MFVSNASQPKISLFLFEYASTLLLSAFTLKETTCSKICSKSWPKSEKSSVPVGVRRLVNNVVALI